MFMRRRKNPFGRSTDGKGSSNDQRQSERTGRFSDGQSAFEGRPEGTQVGRFSTGQELLADSRSQPRVGRFTDGQETIHDVEAGPGGRRVRNDHGLPGMSFRTAFARRKEVTARASEQGLIEAANRVVFHDRGYTLTWNTKTGDLWLTPTEHPDGWWYEEDVG